MRLQPREDLAQFLKVCTIWQPHDTSKSLIHFLQSFTLLHAGLRQEQTVQLTSHGDKTSLLRMTNHLCVCGTVCPPLPGGSGPTVDPIVHRDPRGWGGPVRVSVSNARLIHTDLLINEALCCPLTKGQECLCDAPATKQGRVWKLMKLIKSLLLFMSHEMWSVFSKGCAVRMCL